MDTTNYCKPRGLQKYIFINLQSWSLQLASLDQNWNDDRIVVLSEGSREEFISLFPSASSGHQQSLAHSPFLQAKLFSSWQASILLFLFSLLYSGKAGWLQYITSTLQDDLPTAVSVISNPYSAHWLYSPLWDNLT